jgi:hypothetical protein
MNDIELAKKVKACNGVFEVADAGTMLFAPSQEVAITMENMKQAAVSLTSLLAMKLAAVKTMQSGGADLMGLITALNDLRKVAIVEYETRHVIHESLIEWIHGETKEASTKRIAELVLAYPEHKILVVDDVSQVSDPAYKYPGKIIYVNVNTEILHMQDQ